ncbi:Profilin/allergen [Athelia psychrophila]|uniref:Profilin n=1 Tax=Athelia psychrophila TaxID=1759441 RepID=A0A166KTZ5_9AGAM|nr:Profilin/allergen [Fibularhizoctonia sp. CBS 109695]
MSWQAYVDVQLLATGKIKEAAILALANTGVWAQSAGFNANTQETIRTRINALNAGGGETGGITVGGIKYMFTRATDRSLYGTKKLDDGPHGIVVTKTTQAFIVAKYSPPIQAGEATPVVEGLADYLSSVGY